MIVTDETASAMQTGDAPVVRSISPSDLKDVLARGLDDFWAMPTHVIFIGLVYAFAGLLIGRLAFGYDVIPILYPLAAGFALIGPIAAIGLYEMSRRRELGLKTGWTDVFSIRHSPSRRSILVLGVVLFALFVAWITVANTLFTAAFGGLKPASLAALVEEVLMTENGMWLLIVGNAAGFVFAATALIISAISFPLLLDRKVTAAEAAMTSVRAFMKNPFTMSLWGLIVAVALAIGSLPLFAGLAIVVPVLGHSTWHLYRKVVAPAG
jgi:uncharacterized membrane protein